MKIKHKERHSKAGMLRGKKRNSSFIFPPSSSRREAGPRTQTCSPSLQGKIQSGKYLLPRLPPF